MYTADTDAPFFQLTCSVSQTTVGYFPCPRGAELQSLILQPLENGGTCACLHGGRAK